MTAQRAGIAPTSSTSARAPWTMIACLTALSMLAQVDKTVLTLLVAPIKADLRLSDTEMGLVVGFAFAIANFTAALPAGWLADRVSRRRMIAAGVAWWSVMATLCGAATNFAQLFVARMGVGLGEGVIPPPSYSLIRDGVPQDRHGRAFSLYAAAASGGAGLSLVLGGLLLATIHARGWSWLPIIGAAEPWQICLAIIGVGGLPLTMLAYGFRDPGRASASAEGATFASAFRAMGAHGGVIAALMVFSVLHAMIAASLAMWAPTMLVRSFGLAPQQVGFTLGGVLIVVAPLGLMLAGVIMDRFSARTAAGPANVALGAAVVLGLAAALAPRATNLETFWILQTFVVASSTIYLPVTSTIVARIMPARAIGKTMAIFLFVQGVCGAGLAPVVTGWVADTFFSGASRGLGNALSIVGAVYGVAAFLAAATLRRFLKTPGVATA